MDKRGVSGVVVTVLLVLISIIAVAIVWQVIGGILETSTEDIGSETIVTSVNIKSVNVEANNVQVRVKMGVGGGELAKIKFIFENETDSYSETKDSDLEGLEEDSFTFDLTGKLSKLNKISVAPVITKNDKETLLGITDFLEINGEEGEIEVVPECSDNCSLGQKECVDGSSFRECGNYDSDSCLEWSSSTSCVDGKICEAGNCIFDTLTVGLVSYWSMDEGSGPVIVDSIGNKIGEINEDVVWRSGTDCVSGSCLEFDGYGDYVIYAGEEIRGSEMGTASIWASFDHFSKTHQLVYKSCHLNPGSFQMRVDNGNLNFYLFNQNWGSHMLTDTSRWYHIVMTWNKVGSSYERKAYVNGIEVSSSTNSFTVVDTNLYSYLGAGRRSVGCSYDYPQQTLDGKLDEFRLYGRALAVDEIQRLYSMGA